MPEGDALQGVWKAHGLQALVKAISKAQNLKIFGKLKQCLVEVISQGQALKRCGELHILQALIETEA